MRNKVIHNQEKHRFETSHDGFEAILEYELSDNVMDIYHTSVPGPIEELGIGTALVEEALHYAREHRYQVVPSCAFVQVYLLKHPEEQDLIAD